MCVRVCVCFIAGMIRSVLQTWMFTSQASKLYLASWSHDQPRTVSCVWYRPLRLPAYRTTCFETMTSRLDRVTVSKTDERNQFLHLCLLLWRLLVATGVRHMSYVLNLKGTFKTKTNRACPSIQKVRHHESALAEYALAARGQCKRSVWTATPARNCKWHTVFQKLQLDHNMAIHLPI